MEIFRSVPFFFFELCCEQLLLKLLTPSFPHKLNMLLLTTTAPCGFTVEMRCYVADSLHVMCIYITLLLGYIGSWGVTRCRDVRGEALSLRKGPRPEWMAQTEPTSPKFHPEHHSAHLSRNLTEIE
ncbi:hypothetical protein K440DRAFT_258177 [Wilcoxina mikolae CBS 423.85]|nr:hypothetical protein K440DRAFT_258177 [Wilcoxina mikolae CBS 423.85]